MPSTVAPGGVSQKISNVQIGPIDVAPDIRYVYQTIDDKIYGDLYGFLFPTGGTKLTGRQKKYIEENIVPLTSGDAVIEIYTIADRTGSQKVNYSVTEQRLVNFQMDLAMAGVFHTLVFDPKHKSFGEDFAQSLDEADEVSDKLMRCAVIAIWPNEASSQRVLTNIAIIDYGRTHDQP